MKLILNISAIGALSIVASSLAFGDEFYHDYIKVKASSIHIRDQRPDEDVWKGSLSDSQNNRPKYSRAPLPDGFEPIVMEVEGNIDSQKLLPGQSNSKNILLTAASQVISGMEEGNSYNFFVYRNWNDLLVRFAHEDESSLGYTSRFAPIAVIQKGGRVEPLPGISFGLYLIRPVTVDRSVFDKILSALSIGPSMLDSQKDEMLMNLSITVRDSLGLIGDRMTQF